MPMDPGRTVYRLTRVYVWLLTAIGLSTVVVVLLPRTHLSPSLAGVWFAVGGFGALLVLSVVFTAILE